MQTIEVFCDFMSDFYVLGLELTAFFPGITAQSCETLGMAVSIRNSNMRGGGSPHSENRATL